MTKLKTYLLALLLPISGVTNAQVADTLPGINIRSQKTTDVTSTAVNVQQLDKTTIAALNSVSVADAAKYFSGVVIKDYGGIGGLKTISVRSLGANHTAVLLDGISVGDAQGGQIDLGRFSLENIESIQLAQNQPPNILLPARSFASASILSLSTSFINRDEKSLRLKIKTGSFGYINPSASFRTAIGKRFYHGLFAEYQYANGKYSFKDYETGSSNPKRTNSDIKAYHAEYDAAYFINDSNSIKLKAYYYNSKRGLPGAVILYNDASLQRLNNESWFTQFSWKNNLSAKTALLLSGKYAFDYKFYLDPAYPNSAGKLINEFRQQEIYFSAAYSYKFNDKLSAALSGDFFHSALKRTDSFAASFADPRRNNLLSNVALLYKTGRLEINSNLLYTYTTEKVERGPVAKNYNEPTYSAAVAVQPFVKLPLRIRASYKKIFRVPTFDDLYYTNLGNTLLRPEYVDQYNGGLTVNLDAKNIFEDITLTADGYYNNVKDKILAAPRQNLFQWSMMNIGKAEIKGADIAAVLKFKKIDQTSISTRLSYAYQQALDISDKSSSLYKTQLPYTPEHSGSVNVAVSYKKFNANYNLIASSYRYRLGDQEPGNLINGFITQDVSFAYNMTTMHSGEYQLTAEFNNIFNNQYEIIKYYPMPRFNWRLGITAKF
ncbi:MAG: TonB-dependent receptor [Ferruginibacter sp.]